MLLTKFSHACVQITDGDRRLAIDPGTFSEVETALADVDAVLITHEHADHVDEAELAKAARSNSSLRIWAPKSVVDTLSANPAFEGRLTAVGPGEEFSAGGFPVHTFGGQHALIHSSIPVVSNVCYLVEGTVYHPGDSFVVPTAGMEIALIPINAPWAKLAEAVDFAVSLRAPRAFGIHDALLSDVGRMVYGVNLTKIAAEHGIEFNQLNTGESVQL